MLHNGNITTHNDKFSQNIYLILHCCCSLVAKWCPPLCDSNPPGFSVHEISQARHWSALPFPPPGDLPDPWIKACIGRWIFFTTESFLTTGKYILYHWEPHLMVYPYPNFSNYSVLLFFLYSFDAAIIVVLVSVLYFYFGEGIYTWIT